MPKLRVVSNTDFSDTRHHGGGIMNKGGFDFEEVEVTPEYYAKEIVKDASSHVAYRRWEDEIVMLDDHYYLSANTIDGERVITLGRAGVARIIKVSGNDFWRDDARKFIAETCEDDKIDGIPVDDIGEVTLFKHYGISL